MVLPSFPTRRSSDLPVGLTAHRDGLALLKHYDKASSAEVIRQLEAHQRNLHTRIGTRFVFPSDEFYVCADYPIPDFSEYEDFLQIENGVGLIASLTEEFSQALKKSKLFSVTKNISIATGVSAAPYIKGLVDMLGTKNVSVIPIKNTFFGESITVAGLITGGDLISQLKGRTLGDELFIPQCMLNSDGLFLDDLNVSDVETALCTRVVPIENDGYKLFKALTRRK